MSQAQRLALIAAAIVVLGGGFVLAKGGGDDKSSSTASAASTATSTPATTSSTGKPATAPASSTATTAAATPPVPAVVVSGGQPKGGIKKLSFDKGDTVKFTVTSDVADEIHVHGYDFMKDVPEGGTVSFSFPAKIDGIFEIELENAGVQIAELKVNP